MENEKHVQLLQMAYAGALADAVLQLGKEGVLSVVTSRKRQEQLNTGKMRATQFGITRPEDVFLKLGELFDCARWTIIRGPGGFTAQAKGCKLCAIAKKIGAPSPCHLYCLDPMEGLVKSVLSDASYAVDETLWDGAQCSVRVGTGENLP
jgi:hypothetical protein